MRNELNLPIKKIIHRCLNPSDYHGHMNIPSGYLRISITDYCNMDCNYCHNEGQKEKNTSFLSIDNLYYITSNALRYGLVKVKLTGGEPLLNPDCHKMIRMLKKDLCLPSVGLNTNGTFIDEILPIVSEGVLDEIVIGVDYFENHISKNSSVGMSSGIILNNILKIKKIMKNVCIACVYDGNKERLSFLGEWCIKNNIILKILEISDDNIYPCISNEFTSMIGWFLDRFKLKLGIIDNLSEYFGMINNKPNVYFYHSHCRLRECDICSRIHIRVTSKGFVKSCILSEVEFPLLPPNDFDLSFSHIFNSLGLKPENHK